MDLDEVDKALDMRIIYSLSGNMPVAEFTKRLSLNLQSGMHFSEDSLELSFFIPEELATNREISIFLAQSNATREGNVYFSNFGMATEDLNNAIIGSVKGFKTVILDNIYLSKGTYYLSCRFHSTELPAVTRNIFEYSRKLDGLSVKYLGPNPGMQSILRDVTGITKLKDIVWQAAVPDKVLESFPFTALPEQWVFESRFMTTGLQVSELIRTREKVKDHEIHGFTEVQPDLNLYEGNLALTEPFMKEFFTNLYESRTVRFWRIFGYNHGILRVKSLIPEVLEDNYMASMARLADDFPDWDLSLLEVRELE